MTEDQNLHAEVSGAALRAQSDSFMAQLDRLAELEAQKREFEPTDPRFLALAVEVEDAARALLGDARDQTALGDAAHIAGVDVPIVQIPPDLSTVELIAAWRDAERKLVEVEPDSEEAGSLRLMVDSYRRAYQALFKQDSD